MLFGLFGLFGLVWFVWFGLFGWLLSHALSLLLSFTRCSPPVCLPRAGSLWLHFRQPADLIENKSLHRVKRHRGNHTPQAKRMADLRVAQWTDTLERACGFDSWGQMLEASEEYEKVTAEIKTALTSQDMPFNEGQAKFLNKTAVAASLRAKAAQDLTGTTIVCLWLWLCVFVFMPFFSLRVCFAYSWRHQAWRVLTSLSLRFRCAGAPTGISLGQMKQVVTLLKEVPESVPLFPLKEISEMKHLVPEPTFVPHANLSVPLGLASRNSPALTKHQRPYARTHAHTHVCMRFCMQGQSSGVDRCCA